MHIFLFGGTTEGRKIAEAIAEVNRAWAARDAAARAAHESSGLPIAAEVYVTTTYGASLLPAGPGIRVHVGRLDAEEMTALLEEARQATGFASDETARQQLKLMSDDSDGELEKSGSLKSAGQCSQAERCQLSASLLVIDATHPYAAVVSEHILTACAAAGVRCIRVEREDSGAEEHGIESAQKALPERESTGAGGKASASEGATLHWVESIEEAAVWLAREISDAKCLPGISGMKTQVPGLEENGKERALAAQAAGRNDALAQSDRSSSEASQSPNILITTGSKELAPYTQIPDFAARCYVRALPTVEALEKCQALGFRREHLILMQGPFSEEMNVAQLRYADAGYLVTKASGETGGFPEKCEAALALGVEVICVGRPKEVSIPDATWYDRGKLDAVLRRIREIGTAGMCESSSEDALVTCGSGTTERSEDQAEAADRAME